MAKPNILFIIADQLAAQFLGAYGHKITKTPNLDRLAKSGVVFENAYSSSPLCAPARATITPRAKFEADEPSWSASV